MLHLILHHWLHILFGGVYLFTIVMIYRFISHVDREDRRHTHWYWKLLGSLVWPLVFVGTIIFESVSSFVKNRRARKEQEARQAKQIKEREEYCEKLKQSVGQWVRYNEVFSSLDGKLAIVVSVHCSIDSYADHVIIRWINKVPYFAESTVHPRYLTFLSDEEVDRIKREIHAEKYL